MGTQDWDTSPPEAEHRVLGAAQGCVAAVVLMLQGQQGSSIHGSIGVGVARAFGSVGVGQPSGQNLKLLLGWWARGFSVHGAGLWLMASAFAVINMRMEGL